jgi:hypothetical protein
MEQQLPILYEAAWQSATTEEQLALAAAAGLDGRADPTTVFTSIARQAKRLDPGLATLLWDELEAKHRVERIELGNIRALADLHHRLADDPGLRAGAAP